MGSLKEWAAKRRLEKSAARSLPKPYNFRPDRHSTEKLIGHLIAVAEIMRRSNMENCARVCDAAAERMRASIAAKEG